MGIDWNAPPEATFGGEPDYDDKRPTPYECEYCFTESSVFICDGTWVCEDCARPRYMDEMVDAAMHKAGLEPALAQNKEQGR